MAAFCHYWRIGPAEYRALTLEDVRGMTEWANHEISERERAAKKRSRRR